MVQIKSRTFSIISPRAEIEGTFNFNILYKTITFGMIGIIFLAGSCKNRETEQNCLQNQNAFIQKFEGPDSVRADSAILFVIHFGTMNGCARSGRVHEQKNGNLR